MRMGAYSDIGRVRKINEDSYFSYKNENLIGCKFMVIEPIAELGGSSKKLVAIDNIGAGIGEMVLVAQGSAARIGCNMAQSPVDAAIVGIVDDGTGLGVVK